MLRALHSQKGIGKGIGIGGGGDQRVEQEDINGGMERGREVEKRTVGQYIVTERGGTAESHG